MSSVQPGGTTPPVTSAPGTGATEAPRPTGDHNGSPVTSLDNPDRNLGSLQADQTSGTAIGDRSATKPTTSPDKQLPVFNPPDNNNKPDDPVAKQEKELETAREARKGHSFEQLKEEQEALLKEAGEKFEKVEQHTVLGKALAALDDPAKAPKGVKVTIQLPGEDKPIRLVPPDKKALKGRDVAELTKLAKELLTKYNNDNFTGFNKSEFDQRLNTLQKLLEDLGKEMSKHDENAGNDWQKRFEELQQRQATIVAHQKPPTLDDDAEVKTPRVKVETLGPEEAEKLAKEADPLPDPLQQKSSL